MKVKPALLLPALVVFDLDFTLVRGKLAPWNPMQALSLSVLFAVAPAKAAWRLALHSSG